MHKMYRSKQHKSIVAQLYRYHKSQKDRKVGTLHSNYVLGIPHPTFVVEYNTSHTVVMALDSQGYNVWLDYRAF